jgi:hypothetical protein
MSTEPSGLASTPRALLTVMLPPESSRLRLKGS